MGVTIKDVADLFGKDVFTSKGVYCGKVADVEVDLTKFKLKSLVIEATRNSFLGQLIKGKKGVIVPYSLVQAVGDIVIIKHVNIPEVPEEVEEAAESV